MGADAPLSFGLKRHAEGLWEYEPTAVLWNSDGALCAYTGETLRSVMAEAQADERAPVVLYDIFRAPNDEHVIAIQATENANHPRELKFYCDGRLMPSQEIASCPNPCLLAIQQIQINPIPDPTKPLRMTVEANGHTTEIIVPPYPFADWRPVTLTQVVVQKDYPPVWVRDQALFYHRAHGYERIVFYDNGSDNFVELKDCLMQLDDGLQALLIRWPFPMYRPCIQQRLGGVHDVCAQLAAFNHNMHLIAPRSTYVSQFDLDEYLLNRSGEPLADYLTSQDRDTHRIRAERVANVRASRADIVRAADFKWQSRDKAIRHSDGFYKYIYRATTRFSPQLRFAHVHNMLAAHSASSPRGFFSKLTHYILYKTRLWDGTTYRFGFMGAVDRIWDRWRVRGFVRYHSAKDLVLLHYDGIRTHWGDSIEVVKKSGRGKRLPLDPTQHELSDEMPKLLEQLGLADTKTTNVE